MSINPAQLPDDVQALKALVVKLEGDYERRLGEQVAAYHRELTRFREQLNLALARRFGVSSERIGDEQLRLFNEAESALAQAGAVDDSPVEVPAHTRKRSRRRPLPDSLPRVEVLHELAEAERVCPNDGAELKRIGEESSEQLDIVPAKVQVIRNIRAKYACPSCERHVVTAPMAAQPIPKSLASPGLLAHVTTSKYLDSLPLYRQERIFQRLGVDIPRATLASWMIRSGKLIQPLINLLRDELLGGDIIHCDETTVQVLGEEGRAAESKSYMWVQASANRERPVVLFDYDPSRGGAIPKRLLGEYSGYLITDGYEGYGPVCRANGITQVGCWAHARRKFDEVLKAAGINPRKTPKGKPPPKARKAGQALAFIRALFAIEHRVRDDSAEARYRVRHAESALVLERLRAWLDEQLPTVPPSTALGRALSYLDAQWPKLIRFIEDGRLELTNNRAENAIRPFVLGRKNWLFSATVHGAKASANLYSLVETAKACGLEPYSYLRRVFTELPKATSVEQIEALLPYHCDPDVIPTSLTT